MPFIDAKISKKLTQSELDDFKKELGKAIENFPGKTEAWLMCNIDTGKDMWFKGDNSQETAFLEVKLLGAVNSVCSEKFSAQICDYLSNKLGISSSRVYIRYAGGHDWGWNGSNF